MTVQYQKIAPQVNYMTGFVAAIDKMNRTYRRECRDIPHLPHDWRVRLDKFFGKTLQDELNEYQAITGLPLDTPPEMVLTYIADLLCDIIVYCASECRKYGIPPSAVLQIIMASNESKLGADGQPIIEEETGKFLKGPNYWKPEPLILALLQQIGGEGNADA